MLQSCCELALVLLSRGIVVYAPARRLAVLVFSGVYTPISVSVASSIGFLVILVVALIPASERPRPPILDELLPEIDSAATLKPTWHHSRTRKILDRAFVHSSIRPRTATAGNAVTFPGSVQPQKCCSNVQSHKAGANLVSVGVRVQTNTVSFSILQQDARKVSHDYCFRALASPITLYSPSYMSPV